MSNPTRERCCGKADLQFERNGRRVATCQVVMPQLLLLLLDLMLLILLPLQEDKHALSAMSVKNNLPRSKQHHTPSWPGRTGPERSGCARGHLAPGRQAHGRPSIWSGCRGRGCCPELRPTQEARSRVGGRSQPQPGGEPAVVQRTWRWRRRRGTVREKHVLIHINNKFFHHMLDF